jgi:serine/threonine protein kinase
LDEPEWDDISDDSKDLVRRMLEYDPQKRISAADAL